MAMNIASRCWVACSSRVIPDAEEKTCGLVSTFMMSLYLVTDQYGPNSLSAVKCTGSSRRSRANQSGQTSSWNSRGSATSI